MTRQDDRNPDNTVELSPELLQVLEQRQRDWGPKPRRSGGNAARLDEKDIRLSGLLTSDV